MARSKTPSRTSGKSPKAAAAPKAPKAPAPKAPAPKAKAAAAKPSNPGGLSAKDLRALRKYLDRDGVFGADEVYEAVAQPGAPAFEELLLWLALQPETTVKWTWVKPLEPLWTPVEAQHILPLLPAADGWEGTQQYIRAFMRVEALDVPGFAALLAGRVWPDSVVLAFAFIAWARGEALADEPSTRLAEGFARHVVTEEPLIPPDRYVGRVPFTPRELGRALVGEARWRTVLAAADKYAGIRQLARVPEIFASGDWSTLADLLVDYDRKCTPADERAFLELLEARKDPDDALIALAARLRAAKPASAFADLAELTVATRAPARAAEVAGRLRFASALPFALRASRQALSALPAETRRELMRLDRERPGSEGRSVVGLADDFDAAVLESYLGLSSLDGHALGVLGARALDTIESRVHHEKHPILQLKLSMAFISAIAGAAAAGVTLSPGQLDYVARYPASHPSFKSTLAALPLSSRDAVWRIAAKENTKIWELCEQLRQSPPSEAVLPEVLAILVEKRPDFGWAYLPATVARWLPGPKAPAPAADPLAALRTAAAAMPGETTRIYVFELPRGEAADGELTRLGKEPVRGDRMRHLLSIDLEETPELKPRYPGARVLELHVPRVTGSDPTRAYLDSTLVARNDVAPAPGGRLKLHALDLPARVFDRHARRKDPAASHLATLLLAHPGFVLGEPITIQGDDDGPGTFVMQLDDSFDINLGDSGGLYVFSGGATWDSA